MRWLLKKYRGKSFSVHIINIFGSRVWLVGRYTGDFIRDTDIGELYEYDLALICYENNDKVFKYLIKHQKDR